MMYMVRFYSENAMGYHNNSKEKFLAWHSRHAFFFFFFFFRMRRSCLWLNGDKDLEACDLCA